IQIHQDNKKETASTMLYCTQRQESTLSGTLVLLCPMWGVTTYLRKFCLSMCVPLSETSRIIWWQVYRLSIGAACGLWWPADKLVIQVLDDSTDAGIRAMVEAECRRWAGKGVQIRYENRSNRSGYKAGAMREGLKKGYDMDLAVRASMRGWRFVYAGDVQVRNELPSSFKAYRYQQHRWSCGPANLMRKMFWEIVASRQVSAWKKVHVLYGFFFVRKVVAHLVTFLFYCVVIPAYVLVGGQDVRLPKYVAMYVPAIITLLNAVCTPRSWHLLVFWILFENVMSMHRSKATIIGLVEASRANEWVVTEKLGSVTSSTPAATTTMATNKGATKKKKSQSSILAPEIVMGLCLLYCAVYDIVFGHDHFYVYLLMQSAAAFVIGFGYVGSQ
uniref:Glycosyltransferase 2-like domain-containing protein n=1 Tax=Aegilops tauschii subsp. strangulata TaxID=200361 RepID=A0A453DAY0_AEGTS